MLWETFVVTAGGSVVAVGGFVVVADGGSVVITAGGSIIVIVGGSHVAVGGFIVVTVGDFIVVAVGEFIVPATGESIVVCMSNTFDMLFSTFQLRALCSFLPLRVQFIGMIFGLLFEFLGLLDIVPINIEMDLPLQ